MLTSIRDYIVYSVSTVKSFFVVSGAGGLLTTQLSFESWPDDFGKDGNMVLQRLLSQPFVHQIKQEKEEEERDDDTFLHYIEPGDTISEHIFYVSTKQ